jgi:molybdopterin molybdotransferase
MTLRADRPGVPPVGAPGLTRSVEGLVAPEVLLGAMLAGVDPLVPRPMPVGEAVGLVLAEPAVAPFDLPRFANSAMDGFALAWEDVQCCPARLKVVGRSLAGEPWSGTLRRGEAVAIATGAPVPTGADTVVPVEVTEAEGSQVVVRADVRRGSHVRRGGEDVAMGATVIAAGCMIGPGQLAACGALGLRELVVHPRPVVAVIPTGSEVRAQGSGLGPADVYDAISLPVSALLRELGARPRPYPPVPDDRLALLAALQQAAAQADLIITVGGVSAGERDFVKDLNTVGKVQGYRVALRPARPFAFGTMYGRPLIGLPGNPAAALAAFEVLARPVVLRMLGRQPQPRPPVVATLSEALVQQPGPMRLLRMQVWWEGGCLRTRLAGHQGAGMLHSLAAANAWARMPPGVGEVPAGSPLEVELLADPFPEEPPPVS